MSSSNQYSPYLQRRLLTYIFSTPVYVALLRDGVELPLAGIGYARRPLGAVGYLLTEPVEAYNRDMVVFPQPTADWGDVNGIAYFDALTGGNRLTFTQPVPAKTITTGMPVTIAAGTLRFRV